MDRHGPPGTWPARCPPGWFAGLPVLVAGLGRSGRAAARHLAEAGADVVACDDAPDLDTGEQIDDQPTDGRRAGRLRLRPEWMGTRLSRQSGQPVAVPPGRDQGAPPVGRLPFRPAVVVDGR